jgi:hypothetical protein
MVLDHAQASLDSGSVVVSGETIDFGSHASGDFPSMMARVHNVNYSSTRARLAVNGYTITGGDGRFSLGGPAFPALVSDVGETWTLQFNDAGATPDQSYDATLTFACADEPLPGAAAQPDLVVALHAQVTSGSVAVPRDPSLPTVTRLHTPSPNPVSQQTVLAFDLARPANVRLDVHDLNGRRVATIAEGTMPAGRFQYPWDARGTSGSNLGSGLYFVRLTVAGEPAMLARLAIIR